MANPRNLAIAVACLLAAVPGPAAAQALQKYYLPPSSPNQPQRPVQQADPYARFRAYIQNKSNAEKVGLFNAYKSAYDRARSAGNTDRMTYYANLMSILLKSGVELEQ